MKFTRLDENEDLWITTDSPGVEHGQGKVIIIRTRSIATDDSWIQVPGTRVVLVGPVMPALRRILSKHGRPEINKRTGNLFASSRTFASLKEFVNAN